MTSLSTQLDINALVEMGFTKERVEEAVKAVKNGDIQTVVEWLFNHPVTPDNPDSGHRLGDVASSAPPDNDSNGNTGVPQVAAPTGETIEKVEEPAENVSEGAALSLKCDECGKLIRSEMDAQSHAARSGHQNFSESTEEIKPLTAEEKEEQKQRLQQKLVEKRKDRELADKEQDKVREKTRRRTGQEVRQARDDHALNEMKRMAEERRKEKADEARLKQKLKDDIARDRAAFKELHSKSAANVVKAAPLPAPVEQPVVKKVYDSCRIQFRLFDGSTKNSNFKADDCLEVIYNHIMVDLGVNNTSFELCMTFPRKTFGEQDKSKTLKELGLVPSAALALKKI